MSTSNVNAPEHITSPRSPSTTAPVATKLPWFHQAPGDGQNERRQECLASNAPPIRIKPAVMILHSGTGCHAKNYNPHSPSTLEHPCCPPPLHETSKGRRPTAIRLDGAQSSKSTVSPTIRSRPIRSLHQRAYHNDQPYRCLSIQTSLTSYSHTQTLELPPPTSPTHRKLLKRAWLPALYSSFRLPRLWSLPTIYLALYFALNLGLTLYNKSLLIHFPFPYTLSALHALCGSIGSFVLVRTGSSPPPRLNGKETLVLLAFSVLYTTNIIVSNVSLGLVTVPFHQVVRASTPLFTIVFSATLLGVRSSHAKLIALIPVVAGVGFATYGDYYFTPWGFFLTLLGTVLAALKTIYTNLLQAPSQSLPQTPIDPHPKLSSSYYSVKPLSDPHTTHTPTKLPSLTPLHLLHLLSPLAFIQTTLIAHFSGELDRVRVFSAAGLRRPSSGGFAFGQLPGLINTQLVLLVMNGAMAFGLNVVSFNANKRVGALSMTVAANVKQVLTILCAVALFDLTITPTNAVGIGLTLIGGAFYTVIELMERPRKADASGNPALRGQSKETDDVIGDVGSRWSSDS